MYALYNCTKHFRYNVLVINENRSILYLKAKRPVHQTGRMPYKITAAPYDAHNAGIKAKKLIFHNGLFFYIIGKFVLYMVVNL